MKKILIIFILLFSTPILGASESSKSNWLTWETTDKIDDSIRFMAIISAKGSKSPGKLRVATLVVECHKGETFLYINWWEYISPDKHPVIVRLDKEKAFTTQWDISTNHKTSFYPDSPIPLLKKMMKANQLIARVSPYGSNDITVTFPIKGADTAFQEISKQCKWDAEDKSTSWIIQVAVTSTKESAEKIQNKLKENNYNVYIVTDGKINRIFVGPYTFKEEAIHVAQEIEKKFKEKGIIRPFVPSKKKLKQSQ